MDPRHWLFKHFPSREKVSQNRLLSWLGPVLHAHHLWHKSRRGIALGFGVGIFIGLLVPIAQIPIAGGLAILFRANLPAAVAATFVSNPVTTPALMYGAYHLGAWVTGEKSKPKEIPEEALPSPMHPLKRFARRMVVLGRPLLVGLGLISTLGGVTSYYGIHWMWRCRILAKRRRLRVKPS